MQYVVFLWHLVKVDLADFALSLTCKFAGLFQWMHTNIHVNAYLDGKLNQGYGMTPIPSTMEYPPKQRPPP